MTIACTGIILEDDEEIARNVSKYIEKRTCSQIHVHNNCKDFQLAIRNKSDYTYAIIDLQLPDGSGIDTLKSLRLHHPNVKIIIITGIKNSKLLDEAFELHLVDDYINKPFRMSNLLARLKRRVPELQSSKHYLVDDYYLNTVENTINNQRNNNSIKIEPAVFKCLVLLLEKKNICVSRQEISLKVLNKEYLGGRNIDVIIRKIRTVFKELGISESRLSIENVRITGYILKS